MSCDLTVAAFHYYLLQIRLLFVLDFTAASFLYYCFYGNCIIFSKVPMSYHCKPKSGCLVTLDKLDKLDLIDLFSTIKKQPD